MFIGQVCDHLHVHAISLLILSVAQLSMIRKMDNDKLLPQSTADLEPEKPAYPSTFLSIRMSPTVVSGLTYCSVSAAMVLLNKYALSSFHFSSPNSLLLLQCASSVLLVKSIEALGYWKVERLRWDIVKIWLPVNLIFVLMLATGIWALQLLGVAMVTIMKNLSNLITITGDYFIYGRTYNRYVWFALGLITVSACTGGATDLDFTWTGYLAQLANCLFTAMYSLLLRGVMDKATATLGSKMSTQSEVYYNNILSIPFILVLIWGFGEHVSLPQDPALKSSAFLLAVGVSCFVGFYISYAALWFLSTTTPTTYSLIGSLNKIPVAIIGIIVFAAPTTPANLASIAVGLIAGVLFVRAKQM